MSLRRRVKVLKWKMKRGWDHAEERITEMMYGRKPPTGRLWLLALVLSGFELIFRGIVHLRGRLYQARLLRQEYLGCMVVVIGNLTVGGTGKTPIVEKFARELIRRGRRVAILSRGYKRQEASWLRKIINLIDPSSNHPLVVADGSGKILCDWRRAGDEPYMLAQNLPQAVVIVDKNRVKAGVYAIRKFGVDTLLLDDGFQYFPLKSRQRLVLVDQTNPFGNGALLPRGILRESVKALQRASYVFITKSDGKPSEALLAQIKEHTAGSQPIICAHVPKGLRALEGDGLQPLDVLRGKRVLAFSGIAVPQSFENMLSQAGATVVKTMRYADHYAYEAEDAEQIATLAAAARADMIVTTEKDAVRLSRLPTALPCVYLRMEVEILGGQTAFEQALSQIAGELPADEKKPV